MINYANNEIKYDGCPGCAYAKREFKNHETFEKINEIATLLRKELKKTECQPITFGLLV